MGWYSGARGKGSIGGVGPWDVFDQHTLFASIKFWNNERGDLWCMLEIPGLGRLIKEVFCKLEVSQLLAHVYQECQASLKLTIASSRMRSHI